MTERELISALLADPDKLLQTTPFYRCIKSNRIGATSWDSFSTTSLTGKVSAQLPRVLKNIVTQEQYMCELDVHSHRVLSDENVPAITIKTQKGGYLQIEQYRMAVPFQVLIRDKQVRHLCVNGINHTLLNTEPTDKQMQNFIRFKQMWDEKNMEGAKMRFVKTQKSFGNAGLLYFMKDGKMRTKNISFEDGYIIITHKDSTGKHILECLYYSVTDEEGNQTEYIDCYDDTFMTRLSNRREKDSDGIYTDGGWYRYPPVKHGFSENPLITKRGNVAWDRAQPTIESYEALYNTFIVIQKRYGWGILYVKGKFSQNAKKIASSVVLNDTSMDENAKAEFLNPPSPQNMIETLKLMKETIMISSGTTFVLPDDIKISGDTSGLAVELTQELDMATAQDGVTEWQNVANKMSRLAKEGFAMELVNSGEKGFEKAKTEFAELRIHSKFTVWKPKSEEAHNQMLATLKGAGGISQQTLVEKNTVSTPDELVRIQKEHEAELKEQEEQAEKAAALAQKTSEQTIVSEK